MANVVLKTTKGWYGGFADSMAIPWPIQERIKTNFSTVDEQKRALVKYWVDTLHDAAWTTLAGVLYQMEEQSALDDALKYVRTERGKFHYQYNYYQLLSTHYVLHNYVDLVVDLFLLHWPTRTYMHVYASGFSHKIV